MVDAVQILAMLPRIIKALPGNLRELTAAVEASLRERVRLARVYAPVCGARFIACRLERLAIVEQTLIVTTPSVGFLGECV